MASAVYPEHTGDMKSTMEVISRAREVQGPSNSTTAILAQMRGYSGLTDAFGKRVQWVLGVTLGLWAKGRKVNIRLDTVGDVVILVSSLNFWKKKIMQEGPPEFGKDPQCYYRFILSKDMDIANVNVKYHEFVLPKIEEDAVIVYHHSAALPTSPKKGVPVDYDTSSEKLVSVSFYENDFVMFTPIYGACPFPKDQNVLRQVQAKMTQQIWWPFTPRVFGFGSAAFFQGVLTNMDTVTLVGHGYKPMLKDGKIVPGKFNESVETWVFLEQERYQTQEDWYGKVVSDAKAQTISWLNPLSRYCAISNLSYVSKAGVTLSLSQVVGEQGDLIGNVLSVKVQGKKNAPEKIFVWQGHDPEQDFEQEEAEKEDTPLPRQSLQKRIGRKVGKPGVIADPEPLIDDERDDREFEADEDYEDEERGDGDEDDEPDLLTEGEIATVDPSDL